jgi:hypothetical protein
VVVDAYKIVKFIRLCHVPPALFCKHAAISIQGLRVLSPAIIRFVTTSS